MTVQNYEANPQERFTVQLAGVHFTGSTVYTLPFTVQSQILNIPIPDLKI